MTPTRKTLLTKIESFIKRMRWKAHFLLHPSESKKPPTTTLAYFYDMYSIDLGLFSKQCSVTLIGGSLWIGDRGFLNFLLNNCMREGQLANSKFPALKHLICSTFQPLGLLQERINSAISCQQIYKLSVYAGVIQNSNCIGSSKLTNKTHAHHKGGEKCY